MGLQIFWFILLAAAVKKLLLGGKAEDSRSDSEPEEADPKKNQ